MRTLGSIDALSKACTPPDTVYTFLITGSSAQAADWLSSASVAVANAAAANAGLCRVSGMTTAGNVTYAFTVNLQCTAAAAVSSGLSSGGATNANVPMAGLSPRMFQIPGGSTGFSVGAASSGFVILEVWKK